MAKSIQTSSALTFFYVFHVFCSKKGQGIYSFPLPLFCPYLFKCICSSKNMSELRIFDRLMWFWERGKISRYISRNRSSQETRQPLETPVEGLLNIIICHSVMIPSFNGSSDWRWLLRSGGAPATVDIQGVTVGSKEHIARGDGLSYDYRVDDAPALRHVLESMLQTWWWGSRRRVCTEHPVKQLLADLLPDRWMCMLRCVVVDDDVNAAEGANDLLHDLLAVVLVAEVGGHSNI